MDLIFIKKNVEYTSMGVWDTKVYPFAESRLDINMFDMLYMIYFVYQTHLMQEMLKKYF